MDSRQRSSGSWLASGVCTADTAPAITGKRVATDGALGEGEGEAQGRCGCAGKRRGEPYQLGDHSSCNERVERHDAGLCFYCALDVAGADLALTIRVGQRLDP